MLENKETTGLAAYMFAEYQNSMDQWRHEAVYSDGGVASFASSCWRMLSNESSPR